MDVKGKTKDNPKARMDVKEYCRRKELWLRELQNGKIVKPKASFSFTLDEKCEIVEWVKNLRMPEGYASNLGKRTDMNEGKFIVKEVTLGPDSQVLTMNKYCVNGFKFQIEEVSRNKKTNNSSVYIQGDVDGTGQTIEYYGVIHEIIEVRYSDVVYQNDVAIVQQQVDAELETTLQHPQHILEEVSDDEILNVEEEIPENEENKSFDDEEWDDNENKITEEEEWENDGIETSEEE
ncbi:hypothetical protein RDI58_024261 [Solanum bulbocastanum]|uniref:Uncharacterized protein n=1 Tax=Solanum bulbocastanum TaxID=147425 RepID=A0AAN8T0Q8_SOLBU